MCVVTFLFDTIQIQGMLYIPVHHKTTLIMPLRGISTIALLCPNRHTSIQRKAISLNTQTYQMMCVVSVLSFNHHHYHGYLSCWDECSREMHPYRHITLQNPFSHTIESIVSPPHVVADCLVTLQWPYCSPSKVGATGYSIFMLWFWSDVLGEKDNNQILIVITK